MASPVRMPKKLPRRKRRSFTTTTIAWLERHGILAGDVQRFFPGSQVSIDLWGIGDLLAIDGDRVLLVQITSEHNLNAHLKKIRANPLLPRIARALDVVVVLWGEDSWEPTRVVRVRPLPDAPPTEGENDGQSRPELHAGDRPSDGTEPAASSPRSGRLELPAGAVGTEPAVEGIPRGALGPPPRLPAKDAGEVAAEPF